ncbi:MAG: ABC transporter permease subunit [Saprospiraceae bacterium]|nr:ABC transporter permease subunit [Saprospiraceae bacterium]
MSWLFKLRGDVPKKWRWILELSGIGLILCVWFFLTSGMDPIMMPSVLPHPMKVLTAFGELYQENNLIQNMFKSIGFNLAGYVKAMLFTLPLGFLIGLYPLFKGMYQRTIDAVRFVPLAATTGLFIVWFGIGTPMKVNFLAFGILIFLLPVVVQRINEVKGVYLKTVYTIGATDWQTIKSVYIPSVMSRLIDDVRVMTAISWTYIVVAEGIGSEGGLGAMIFRVGQRQGRVDKTFAVLLLIILIGIIQDRIFVRLDKELFPHKYQIKEQYSRGLKRPSLWDSIFDFGFKTLTWVGLAMYLVLALNEIFNFIGVKVLDYLFGDTCWVVHVILIGIILYKGRKAISKHADSITQNKLNKSESVS